MSHPEAARPVLFAVFEEEAVLAAGCDFRRVIGPEALKDHVHRIDIARHFLFIHGWRKTWTSTQMAASPLAGR